MMPDSKKAYLKLIDFNNHNVTYDHTKKIVPMNPADANKERETVPLMISTRVERMLLSLDASEKRVFNADYVISEFSNCIDTMDNNVQYALSNPSGYVSKMFGTKNQTIYSPYPDFKLVS